jgi:predicted outer membrane repeat protein
MTNNTLNSNRAGFPADTGNPGKGRGGAIFSSGTLTLDHTNFGGNSAQISGGGVFVDTGGTATITSGGFTANIATNSDGGGLFTAGGVANLTGVTFTGNTAGRFGGGARLNAAVIQHSTFTANTSASEGGGVLLFNTSEVIASTFTSNTSSLSGGVSMGGPSDRSQTLQVINSLFHDNHCTSPSGVADMRLFDLTIDLVNNTFARPAVVGQTSVAFFRSNLSAENNIWNGYLTSLIEGQTAPGITMSEDYNLLFNAPLGVTVPPGAHNLTTDPQFVNPVAADFSLRSSSPAIDSGDDSALPAGILTDLANQPRFIDSPGAPNTGVGTPPVDRGAFEYSLKALYLPVIVR